MNYYYVEDHSILLWTTTILINEQQALAAYSTLKSFTSYLNKFFLNGPSINYPFTAFINQAYFQELLALVEEVIVK